MPKLRRTGRKINKRMFILCEGRKTEPYYFNALIDHCNFMGTPVEVSIIKTTHNTPKELVLDALSHKELEIDEVWVVFDKDGYTKHPETFEVADKYNIHIAFSSISFEIWILLHFMITKRQFTQSFEVIEFLKQKNFLNFKKNDKQTFHKVKHLTNNAINNAQKLRKYQVVKHPTLKIYQMNPITNVDILVTEILNLKKKL